MIIFNGCIIFVNYTVKTLSMKDTYFMQGGKRKNRNRGDTHSEYKLHMLIQHR